MMMKPKTPQTTASANYRKRVLTLDLPRAVQPMLWRQEIKNISNVVFRVSPEANGEFALLMKISTADEQSIARFASMAAAEESLLAVRRIFTRTKSLGGFLYRLLKTVFLILAIIVLGFMAIEISKSAINQMTATGTLPPPMATVESQQPVSKPPTDSVSAAPATDAPPTPSVKPDEVK